MSDYGGGRSGGSRYRRRRSSGAAGAVLLALIGVVLVASRQPTGSSGLPAAEAAAAAGRYTAAWQALKLHGGRVGTGRSSQCATNSYGQVRDFFADTPCRSLHRELLAVSDTAGNTIAVSVAWVRLPTAAAGRALKALVDRDGTGSVRPLPTSRADLATVRFAGRYYASRRSGSLVVIAEAAPARGHPTSTQLHDAARVGAAFPVPS